MSFADDYFDNHSGLLDGPFVKVNGETYRPHREGDSVFVNTTEGKFQILSVYGYWNNAVVELRKCAA